jgi:hypothetical protein
VPDTGRYSLTHTERGRLLYHRWKNKAEASQATGMHRDRMLSGIQKAQGPDTLRRPECTETGYSQRQERTGTRYSQATGINKEQITPGD